METVVKKLYEGMFLVDTAQAASDWDGINKAIVTVLERSDAEIVSIKKWDERKLAYDVQKNSRGTYLLCYFKVDGTKIRDIERDVQLSERIMRVLILSTEAMSQEDIDRDTPATVIEKRSQEAAAKAEAAAAEKAEAAAAEAKAATEAEVATETEATTEAEVAVEAEAVVEDAEVSEPAAEDLSEAVTGEEEQPESPAQEETEKKDQAESVADESEEEAKEDAADTSS